MCSWITDMSFIKKVVQEMNQREESDADVKGDSDKDMEEESETDKDESVLHVKIKSEIDIKQEDDISDGCDTSKKVENSYDSESMNWPKRKKIVWPRVAEAFMMERVRDNPALWDIRDPMYAKKSLKTMSYTQIAEQLKEVFPTSMSEVNGDTVRQKYNNLKNYFLREYKKVEAEEGYVSPWELFDIMSFLKDGQEMYGSQVEHVTPLQVHGPVEFLDPLNSPTTPMSSPSPAPSASPTPASSNTSEKHSAFTLEPKRRKISVKKRAVEDDDECQRALKILNAAMQNRRDKTYAASIGQAVTHILETIKPFPRQVRVGTAVLQFLSEHLGESEHM